MSREPKRTKTAVLHTTGAIACALALLTIPPASALDLNTVEDTAKSATVLLSGGIAQGDSLKIRGALGALASAKSVTVHLNLAGGNRTEAMSIGLFFHRSGIRTVVPAKARCVSPCPLMLVGGRDPLTGKPSYLKYSTASLGFSSAILNFQEKEYTAADMDATVAGAQRDILNIADYLRGVGADINVLKYYQSALKPNETRFITNEQTLDLGIPVLFEETGQVIEPIRARR